MLGWKSCSELKSCSFYLHVDWVRGGMALILKHLSFVFVSMQPLQQSCLPQSAILHRIVLYWRCSFTAAGGKRMRSRLLPVNIHVSSLQATCGFLSLDSWLCGITKWMRQQLKFKSCFYSSYHIYLGYAACVGFDADSETVNKSIRFPQALSGFRKASFYAHEQILIKLLKRAKMYILYSVEQRFSIVL